MRYVVLLAILLSYPVFLSFLRSNPQQRHWAVAGLSFMLFLTGQFRIETYLIDWPLWAGTVRGMGVSPIETLCIALIVTRKGFPRTLPFWGVLIPYALILALSLLMSKAWIASLFVFWQYCRILLLFAAIAGEVHSRPSLKALMTGLNFGLSFQAIVVIGQKLNGVVQAGGTMPHQNILGMVVELSMLPLLAFFFAGERSKSAILGLFAALIIVAGGGSRGTVIFLFSGMALFAIISLVRGSNARKLKTVGIGILVLLVISPIGLYTMKSRFKGESMITAETERAAFKNAARAVSADFPLGVGANMYVTTANLGGYSARAKVPWNTNNRAAPVHDAYLLARAETGWQGEISFIILLAWPAIIGVVFAFKRRKGVPGEICLGSAVGIAANIVHNNFEYATHSYVVQALVITNIAIIAAQVRAGRMGYVYFHRPIMRRPFENRHLSEVEASTPLRIL